MPLRIKKVSKYFPAKGNRKASDIFLAEGFKSPLRWLKATLRPTPPVMEPALLNINLEIADGEFVAIVGPSGCGKSTLLNMIAGFEKPDEGLIEVDGVPIQGPGRDRVMVFQESALFPWLTVEENVEFGLKMMGIPPEERRQKTAEYLRMVHLSRYARAYPFELSGGMKQRVALARSLIMNPKILLMDEPFASLDEQTRTVLQGELQNLWMETRKTVVFITHSLSEAVLLADRVILMTARPGRILWEHPIQASHPRDLGDWHLVFIRNDLFRLLAKEVEKAKRAEMDNDWHLETNHLPTDITRYLGGNI